MGWAWYARWAHEWPCQHAYGQFWWWPCQHACRWRQSWWYAGRPFWWPSSQHACRWRQSWWYAGRPFWWPSSLIVGSVLQFGKAASRDALPLFLFSVSYL